MTLYKGSYSERASLFNVPEFTKAWQDESDGQGTRVLLADDDPALRRVLSIAFRHIPGFDLVTVANGDEALAKAKEVWPVAIFLDSHMSGMSGLEACRRLKKDAGTRSIPVFILTGMGVEREQQTVLQVGAQGALAKPFRPQDMVDMVRQYVSSFGVNHGEN